MRLLMLILTLVVCAAPAVAGPFEDAKVAYDKGDYATALQLYRPLAERGNPRAQSNLGVMYARGQAVPQDYQQAVFWYRKAADQDNAIAQFNLGVMYDEGRGVPQDFVQATAWYRKAADQGYAEAQSNLGLMYELGQGVPQDFVQAHMWFNLAASRLPASGKVNRELAVKNRDAVAAKMTPAQIADAQKLAREWKVK